MILDNNNLQYSFIDSKSEWECVLKTCKYKLNNDLFQIDYSFFKHNKINQRKRKKPTEEFSELEEFHLKLFKILSHFRSVFIPSAGTNQDKPEVERELKNVKALDISKKYLEHDILMHSCCKLAESNQITITDKNMEYFHEFIENCSSNQWQVLEILSGRYLIPPAAAFIMSDIKFANRLLRQIDKRFDLIVIDPPVKNKSVKNINAYKILDELELLELPVKHLVKPGGLVTIWCTNSQKCMDSVETCLFRAWGVRLKAACSWLKVTNSGEPVLDINDRFRRPYEKLFIGRVATDQSNNLTDPLSDLDDHVILSVPCSMHSAKPNLQNFLSKYLPSEPKCLELFARNLYPGWVSWGNEPLKFLNVDLMVNTDEDKSE